jgi:hypothetical protein
MAASAMLTIKEAIKPSPGFLSETNANQLKPNPNFFRTELTSYRWKNRKSSER